MGTRMTNYLKCAFLGKRKQLTYNKDCHTARKSVTYTNKYVKLKMFATSTKVSISQMCE